MAENTGQFNWQMLGKPDHSLAAAIISSLPKDVRNDFRGRSERVFTKLFFLSWSHAFHSGRGTAYCEPSQTWLGEDVERSRFTISSYLKDLRDCGLLTWFRRSPVDGKYKTCVYSLGKRALAVLYAYVSKTAFPKNHVEKAQHNDLKKGNIRRGANEEASPSLGILTGKSKTAPFSTAQFAFAGQKGGKDEQQPTKLSTGLLARIEAQLA